MSSGENSRTKSAIVFNTKTRDAVEGNSRIPSKRKWEDELTPAILVEQTSTSTQAGEKHNETTHYSRQLRSTDKDKEQIALKLNWLKDKAVRCTWHKDFLCRWIPELAPKGFKLKMEPKIGNYDQVRWRVVPKVKNLLSDINERHCRSMWQNHC